MYLIYVRVYVVYQITQRDMRVQIQIKLNNIILYYYTVGTR